MTSKALTSEAQTNRGLTSKNLFARLDGKALAIQPGETILAFTRRHQLGNRIPTLCDDPRLAPFGACRVCSVEVVTGEAGKIKTVASCHTLVEEGMQVYTSSESIRRLRRNIVELVLTDHPLDCLTCEVNGNCELQDVAASVGIREVRYWQPSTHLDRDKDESHPLHANGSGEMYQLFALRTGL